ncbi:Small subunit (SSU) processome component, partial [Ascosphaera atra]
MPAKQQKPSTATTATTASSASAILHSAFTPSTSQWSLFASVIQGLDAQRIRIHDVASHRLLCEHAVAPKELVTSLDWGYLATTSSANASTGASESASAKKKRRRSSSTANALAAPSTESQEELVLAFGTSTGDIRIFSPAQDRIVTVAKSQGPAAIVDAKFTAPAAPGTASASTELWSVTSDGKLSRWDLTVVGSAKLVRSLALPTSSVSTLARPVGSNPPVLVASQTPFLVSVGEEGKGEKAEGVVSFAAMRNSIHTLLASSTTKLGDAQFLAADADRYVNLFDVEKKKLLGNLVAAKEVERLALYVPQQQKKGKQTQQQQQQTQVLAAVTRGGAVEFFTHPFSTNQQLLQQQTQQQQGQHSQASLKALRKSQTRRAAATLVLRRPNASAPINVIAAGFTGDG